MNQSFYLISVNLKSYDVLDDCFMLLSLCCILIQKQTIQLGSVLILSVLDNRELAPHLKVILQELGIIAICKRTAF